MKAIVQRVTCADVTVSGEVVGKIGRGLCVLLGICQDDTAKDIDYMIRKLLDVRLFEDPSGKRWCRSVKDENLEILCISQFTLYHRLKGNKPDFHYAMSGERAQQLYDAFLKQLRTKYPTEKVQSGTFGAYMQVNIQNDGPVTIELESPVTKQNDKSNL